MTVGIKERLAVRAVIEEKGLIVAALAEVTAQKRQNAVFRFDLRGEHAADVGKAHEAAVLLQLAVQLPHSAQQGMVRFIGKALQQRLSLAVELGGKAIDGKLFFGQACPVRAAQKWSDLRRKAPEAFVYAACVRRVRRDVTDLIQAWLELSGAEKRGGELLLRVAFVDAAQKSIEAAVVFINDLAPCHKKLLIMPAQRVRAGRAVPPGARHAPWRSDCAGPPRARAAAVRCFGQSR